MAATFISYRRDDAAGYAGRLRESLERRLGPEGIFRDVDALKPGQDFVRAIEARLAACQVMLVVIGREWLDARQPSGGRRLDDPLDFVRIEVAVGLARRQVLVVPVLVEGATMPPSDALPENIRALARRHALSLRDETWDEDVARLVSVINETVSSPSAPSGGSSNASAAVAPSLTFEHRTGIDPRIWGAAGVLLILLIVALYLGRGAPTDPSTVATDVKANLNRQPSMERGMAPYTIDIPRVAEVAFGDRLYTLVSGNVVARGDVNELRLRIRLSNYGPVDTNFWNQTFRMSAHDRTFEPSSDLNDIVPGHSLRYGILSFLLPPDTKAAALRLADGSQTAEIALDVAPTGRPPVDERANVPDSSSQALGRIVSGDSVVLLQTDAIGVTLLRATSRRFANVLRLSLQTRLKNLGPTPVHSGIVTFRVTAGDDVLAPLEPPNEAMEAGVTISPTIVFDLAPSAERAVLHTTSGAHSGTQTFELH